MFKEQLFSNWYPMRWFMLVLGIALGFFYLVDARTISGLLSLIVMFQALTNTGCLLGRCTPAVKDISHTNSELDNVTFEEIKNS